MTPPQFVSWQLRLHEKRLSRAERLEFLVNFRGVWQQSPLKMCLCLLVVLETIVPYFVLSIFKAFFFLMDGSRFLIGHR